MEDGGWREGGKREEDIPYHTGTLVQSCFSGERPCLPWAGDAPAGALGLAPGGGVGFSSCFFPPKNKEERRGGMEGRMRDRGYVSLPSSTVGSLRVRAVSLGVPTDRHIAGYFVRIYWIEWNY